MSTVHVDDRLYQQTKEVALALGKSVDEFAEVALRDALVRVGPPTIVRNGLLVFDVAGMAPTIEPATVRHWIEEEGF
ncbi:MAG: hypothetical protein WD851_18765 [Pirellulales bacterium]